ncbi:MAG: lipopolysaccharide heptosyltransferase II [Candidatus Omnitrophica bacterium]|nr:lipopolysaccharide heptosyltransferase II [Candidatus Omnitrophota bacterium]
MKKFLIINPFGIGDVLFTTPLAKAIKDNYPDSRIGYWCNERVRGIINNNPDIDKIFALSRGDLKKIFHRSRLEGIKRFLGLLSAIKKEKFEAVFDFSLEHRYSLISKLLGIKKRIGFNYKNRGRFLTDKIDIDGYNNRHAVEYYLDLLQFVNIKPGNSNLNIFVSQGNKVKAENILIQAGIQDRGLLVGIAPGAGASWGQDASLKHWPAARFAQLADRLISDFGAKILILGDITERPIADTVINTMNNKAIDLTGKTSLEELIAIIDKLHILISNDGGPLHIACALNKKTVSFFGPVDSKVYGPYPPDAERHIVLKKNLECSPCYRNFRLTNCLRNRQCLEDIDVALALSAVSSLLSKKENI